MTWKNKGFLTAWVILTLANMADIITTYRVSGWNVFESNPAMVWYGYTGFIIVFVLKILFPFIILWSYSKSRNSSDRFSNILTCVFVTGMLLLTAYSNFLVGTNINELSNNEFQEKIEQTAQYAATTEGKISISKTYFMYVIPWIIGIILGRLSFWIWTLDEKKTWKVNDDGKI